MSLVFLSMVPAHGRLKQVMTPVLKLWANSDLGLVYGIRVITTLYSG